MKKTHKRKKATKSLLLKKKLRYSRGRAGVGLLLAIIIAGSVVMLNGVFPQYTPKAINPDEENQIVTPSPFAQYDSLQLQTFKFKACGSDSMLDFLIDESGSMSEKGKEANLKTALTTFTNVYPSGGIVGMQYFTSDRDTGDSLNYEKVVPIDYFNKNKSQFLSAIQAYNADSGTPTKSAFVSVEQDLKDAIKKYPNKKYNLVFISDGVPETGSGNRACVGGINGPLCEQFPGRTDGSCRCFDTNQDPTSVANDIKKLGVHIFTIGYVAAEDEKFKDDLTKLMTNVASSPSNFYQAPSDNEITVFLKDIATKFCEEKG